MTHHLGQVPLAGSPFPPIADYAFLSDCEVTALVAPSGNIEWMCLPRFDGPSIFGQTLDRDAGGFRLGPADTRVPAGRRYLPGTMVLETTWDRGARLAMLREEHDLAVGWRRAADEIHADVCANAVDERGVFTIHYDTAALDASALLLPLVRFLRRRTRGSAPPSWPSPTN